MKDPKDDQLRDDPGNRNDGGLIGRALRSAAETIQRVLARLIQRKHPGDFEREFGDWQLPDVNLSSGTPVPPGPLINRNCKQSTLVYCFVANRVNNCTIVEQLAALRQAQDIVLQYFQQQFECKNPNCIKKVAEPVWFGIDCFSDPTEAGGAVLVRFRCEVEL